MQDSELTELAQKRPEDEEDPFTAKLYYNHKSVLYGFEASGATGFQPFGEDIVAAGVSALVLNTVHSLDILTGDGASVETRENYMKCLLPELQHKNRGSREAVVLLKSLELGLESILNTYGEQYVMIERIYEKRKAGFLRIIK